jgi:hypothetical protein
MICYAVTTMATLLNMPHMAEGAPQDTPPT